MWSVLCITIGGPFVILWNMMGVVELLVKYYHREAFCNFMEHDGCG